MKFLIIGAGFISKKHFEAIWHVGGEVVGVLDKESDWKYAIKNTEADTIVILTPNYLHYEMVLEATKNNKIVLCEKPLVLENWQAEELVQYPNIFTVLQLRHHPNIERIISAKKEKNEITARFIVPRSDDYFKGWQGDDKKSGGILFVLGSHYFDLLIHLFGYPTGVRLYGYNHRRASGQFIGENYECDWILDQQSPREERSFIVNYQRIDLKQRTNLHQQVYEDLVQGKGVKAEDVIKLTKLINHVKNLAIN